MSKRMHRMVRLIEIAIRKPVYVMSEKEIEKFNNIRIPDNVITRKIFNQTGVPSEKQELVIPVHGGEISGTLFMPRSTSVSLTKKTPAILYFHGGGWVMSAKAMHTRFCERLSSMIGIPVLSVEYRLAPSHKFPTAAEDAFDSLVWLHDHADGLMIDQDLIYVMGTSSGGNLAASVSLMARDREGPKIHGQILHCPVTDGRMVSEAYKLDGKLPILTKKDIEFFITAYCRDKSDIYNPYFSPLLAQNHTGLPKALIITAEYDLLRDDGAQYAKILRKAGVSATYLMCRQTIHAFLLYPHADGKKEAERLITEFIGKSTT